MEGRSGQCSPYRKIAAPPTYTLTRLTRIIHTNPGRTIAGGHVHICLEERGLGAHLPLSRDFLPIFLVTARINALAGILRWRGLPCRLGHGLADLQEMVQMGPAPRKS